MNAWKWKHTGKSRCVLRIWAYRYRRIHSLIQDRAHDDKHSGRVAKQYEQQQVDMQNSKKLGLVQQLVG